MTDRTNILTRNEDYHRNQQEADSSVSTGCFSNDMKELLETSDPGQQSSLKSASFNYINSIIGSGVIGIPFAFRQAGFGLGLLLLVMVAAVTDYSLVLMVRGGHLAGIFSYQGLMEASFGRTGFVLLSLLQFVYPVIAMISYNVVVGDTVTKVFVRMFRSDDGSLLARRELTVGLATLFVTLPLCLYRDIGKLAKVSLFSLVCVGFILMAVILKFFLLFGSVPSSPDAWEFADRNIVPAIGIITFAFMCHHNTFLIYGSIEGANQRRWDKVTHVSLFVSFVLACLFGVAGYSTFTGYSQGDLLENYCPDDDLANAARIFFSITILLTYPIECFVAREVLENTVFANVPDGYGILQNKHFVITFAIVGFTYLISMTTDCLGIVLELNGVLAAVPLAYILPGMCYLKLDTSPLLSREKLPALSLVAFGFCVALFGLISLLADYKNIGNCSHGRVMHYCVTNSTSVM